MTEEILKILNRALTDKERGLGNLNISPEKGSLEHIAKMADGDARKALSALEIAALTTQPGENGNDNNHTGDCRGIHPEKGDSV